MAKVIITTKLWDTKEGRWYNVHEVSLSVSDDEATKVKEIFLDGSETIQSENPSVYKKHIQFTTEMSIENDNGHCIGGFKNY